MARSRIVLSQGVFHDLAGWVADRKYRLALYGDKAPSNYVTRGEVSGLGYRAGGKEVLLTAYGGAVRLPEEVRWERAVLSASSALLYCVEDLSGVGILTFPSSRVCDHVDFIIEFDGVLMSFKAPV